MSGTIASATKAAATRIGVPFADYIAYLASGRKYCCSCRQWKRKTAFGLDRTRGDGLAARCVICRRGRSGSER